MQAVRYYVLVERIRQKPRVVGGIEIPEDQNEEVRYYKGQVKSVGRLAAEEGVERGQIVLYDKHAGHDQDFGDGPVRVITVGDIVTIV